MPRPSAVTPPGPGPSFPPCRAVLPEGLGFSASLTLIHPASDAASAETTTAAAVARERIRLVGGRDEGAGVTDDDGDGVGVRGEWS